MRLIQPLLGACSDEMSFCSVPSWEHRTYPDCRIIPVIMVLGSPGTVRIFLGLNKLMNSPPLGTHSIGFFSPPAA